MEIKNKKIGFVLTGSFYTIKKVVPQIRKLKEFGANILPIMSYTSFNTDIKFFKVTDFIKDIEKITENEIIHTIQDAEPIGFKHLTDMTN